MQHGPLVIRPDSSIRPCGAGCWQMLRNCTAARYAVNKARMVPLAEYSRDCLRALRAETGIAYDERSQGTLQLFRTQKQLDGTGEDIEVLQAVRRALRAARPAGCIAAEPALAACAGKFVGGLRLPSDETGDCHMFTQAPGRRWPRRSACSSATARRSSALAARRRPRSPASAPAPARCSADAYVVGARQLLAALLRPIGMPIPVYPVKGYSITVPITDADRRAGVDRDGRDATRSRSRGWATASASAARPSSSAMT